MVYRRRQSILSGFTVWIEENAHQIVQTLSTLTGESMQSVVLKVIEGYRRKIFFESANHAFKKFRCDLTAWAQELKEREEWDRTLSDGLEKG